jgi:hypothetical protein
MTPTMETTGGIGNSAIQDPISLQTAGTGKSFVQRFFAFDEFIMGRLLKIVYVLGSILIVLYAVLQLATRLYAGLDSLSNNFHIEKVFWILVGFGTVLLASAAALLMLRLYCELLMVIFKIYESLQAGRAAGRTV